MYTVFSLFTKNGIMQKLAKALKILSENFIVTKYCQILTFERCSLRIYYRCTICKYCHTINHTINFINFMRFQLVCYKRIKQIIT